MADNILIKPASGPPASRGDFSAKWQVDGKYIVTLDVRETDGSSFNVSTTLDESFSLSMGAQWNAPFANVAAEAAQSMSGPAGAVARTAGAGMQALGLAARNKYQTAQVWQSSDSMSLTIPFTFIATTNAKTEVADKVRNMLKLAAPKQRGWGLLSILEAPGPTLIDQTRTDGRKISVQIGDFIKLYNVVVKRVDAQFDSLIGVDGIPLKAKVNVDVESYYTCFTTDDIDSMFEKTDPEKKG